ncbi:MAG: GNAT family N-acetyltransferase [Bdellovibrionota bacterium]
MEKTLTETLLGFSWDKYFPKTFGQNNWLVRRSSFEECCTFTEFHYKEVILDGRSHSPFLWDDQDSRRTSYYKRCGDFFAFEADREVFGVFCGNCADWSTYYLRHTLLKKKFQGTGFYQAFIKYFLELLGSEGVPRIEADIHPGNHRSIHVCLKAGFIIKGMSLSERWGAVLHLIKYFDRNRQEVFLNQFCHGTWSVTDSPEPSGQIFN